MSETMFPLHFINAGSKYSTLEEYVAAPYFRRVFEISKEIRDAKIQICGLGFYELHVNGVDITKGHLAPYRSNHDHYVYVDAYDVEANMKLGRNVIAILLGNGMQNAQGGSIWEFDKAPWRTSPQVSFELHLEYLDGEKEVIVSDALTRVHPSPIIFDDLHLGEYYDASAEIEGWDMPEYDDSQWDYAKQTAAPRGEARISEAESLKVHREIMPISITECDGGYIYDFGVNTAGVCRLCVDDGTKGQTIRLQHFEVLHDGKPFFDGIRFDYMGNHDPFQEDIYYCAGRSKECYTPHFTYHGFRYVYVTGITREQARSSLLTYLEIYSDIKKIGSFECSDDIANRIQEATVQSDISNFHYFPTDCPQREKNGWTADAALSAEQMLLNLTTEKSYREWMRNIYKAINEEGKIPGIIPTTGWGYDWGNGPAWDSVLVYIPYYTYRYRGDEIILKECAIPLMRYLTYLYTRLTEDDLVEYGLGDWCQARKIGADFDTPLVVTDTIMTIDIARKAEFIYEVLGMKEAEEYAKTLADRVTEAFRKHLIDPDSLIVKGDTQTAQAMALYYGMFTENEREEAFAHLLQQIERDDEYMAVGVLGGRVIFRLLADNGKADLAYHMIARPDFPSYGNWIVRGATTLWETFFEEGGRILSMNHHFWGDVSAWFYYYPGGLHFNPTGKDIHHIEIAPCFIDKLEHARVTHLSPDGEIIVCWKREGRGICLYIQVPNDAHGHITLTQEWCFEEGDTVRELRTGVYKIKKRKG